MCLICGKTLFKQIKIFTNLYLNAESYVCVGLQMSLSHAFNRPYSVARMFPDTNCLMSKQFIAN